MFCIPLRSCLASAMYQYILCYKQRSLVMICSFPATHPSRLRVTFSETFQWLQHYNDVLMMMMASQITGLSMVYPTICSGADQRKHKSSASLAFVMGIHRWPVNSPRKGPVTRKLYSFDYVIMTLGRSAISHVHAVCLISKGGKVFSPNRASIRTQSSKKIKEIHHTHD